MSWDDFYKKHERTGLSEIYQRAMKAIKENPAGIRSGTAIDLGCGNGNETLDMLRQGWHVIAVDNQKASIDLVKGKLTENDRQNIELIQMNFEQMKELPPASFVFANNSLPFCAANALPSVLEVITGAMEAGGFFAGSFFGPKDEWVQRGTATGVTKDALAHHFSKFNHLQCEEIEETGPTAAGPDKHWHVFKVIMQKKM